MGIMNRLKNKSKGKDKKKSKKKALVIGLLTLSSATLVLGVNGAGSLLLSQSSIVAMSIWGEEMKDIEKQTPKPNSSDCPCKCVWVTNQNGQQSVTVSNNNTSVTVPSYGASTGSVTNTSSQVKVPTPKNNDQRLLLEHLLPGAVVASQYYNINIRMTLGTAPNEGGWPAVRNGASNDYHIFSVQGPGPMTGKTHGSKRWSSHEDYNDAIMHYATNFYKTKQVNSGIFNNALANYSYESMLNTYSQGGEAQIREMSLTGFNNYMESGAKTLEEYKAAAQNYANKIISVTSNIPEIDNIDVAMEYIRQNNLTDAYNAALAMKDRYEAKYNKGYANATPNGSNSNNQASNTANNTGTGYWLCNCEKPCKLCHCHDNETASNNQSQSTTNGTFPQSVAGTASGLWGTAEQLAQYIEQLNSSNAPNGCGNVERLKNNLRALIPMMGVSPVQPYTYATDKFVGSDGIGFVTYSQSRNFGIEPYFRSCYNDGNSTNFAGSGCGLYATAMVLSTLEKKWVNPAEVAIALQTYGVRNNTRIGTTVMGSSGAAYESGLKALITEAGYNVKSTTGVNIDTLDDCLSKNGCMIYVVGAKSGLTSGGHYVVVREKTADGKYLMGNSTRRNNNTFTEKQIKSYIKSQDKPVLYVYPRVDPIKTTLGNNVSSGGQFSSLPTSSNNLNGEIGDKIVAEAHKYLGIKYVYGGSSPSGFDCSGLMQYSYSQLGVNIPRNSAEQYKNCKKITKAELQPGDLVFGSRDGKKVNHVMMYIGNGQVIHAPRTGDVVKIISLDSYKNQFGYGTYLR